MAASVRALILSQGNDQTIWFLWRYPLVAPNWGLTIPSLIGRAGRTEPSAKVRNVDRSSVQLCVHSVSLAC